MNCTPFPESLSVFRLLDINHCNCSSLFSYDPEYPWMALTRIDEYFKDTRGTSGDYKVIGHAYIAPDVAIGEGTIIEEGATILGPAWIGNKCHIRGGAYIRDHCIIGDNVVIGHASEIKRSLIFDDCQIAHFNYVGDAILGRGVHLAAGAKISNLRLLPGTIKIHTPEDTIQTALEKLGAIIGDYAQVGCNAVLNPGSILGRKSIVMPLTDWRGYLPENTIAPSLKKIQ